MSWLRQSQGDLWTRCLGHTSLLSCCLSPQPGGTPAVRTAGKQPENKRSYRRLTPRVAIFRAENAEAVFPPVCKPLEVRDKSCCPWTPPHSTKFPSNSFSEKLIHTLTQGLALFNFSPCHRFLLQPFLRTGLCAPPTSSHGESLNPNVILLGDSTLKEVIIVK